MKKILAILILSSLLTGCFGIFAKKDPVIEYRTIYREIPQEYLNVPKEIADLDYNDESLTDEDVGLWLIKKDNRETVLEELLNSIILFNDESIKLNEKAKEKQED